jgi:hypothetical protein
MCLSQYTLKIKPLFYSKNQHWVGGLAETIFPLATIFFYNINSDEHTMHIVGYIGVQ